MYVGGGGGQGDWRTVGERKSLLQVSAICSKHLETTCTRMSLHPPEIQLTGHSPSCLQKLCCVVGEHGCGTTPIGYHNPSFGARVPAHLLLGLCLCVCRDVLPLTSPSNYITLHMFRVVPSNKVCPLVVSRALFLAPEPVEV